MDGSDAASALGELSDDALTRWLMELLYTGTSTITTISSVSHVSTQLHALYLDLPPKLQIRFYESLARAAVSLELHHSKAVAIRETVALVGLTRNVLAVPALVHLLSESGSRLFGYGDDDALVAVSIFAGSVLAGMAADPSVREFCLTQLRWPGTDQRLVAPLASVVVKEKWEKLQALAGLLQSSARIGAAGNATDSEVLIAEVARAARVGSIQDLLRSRSANIIEALAVSQRLLETQAGFAFVGATGRLDGPGVASEGGRGPGRARADHSATGVSEVSRQDRRGSEPSHDFLSTPDDRRVR